MLLVLAFFMLERLVFDPALELFIKWNDLKYFRFSIRFLDKLLGRLEPERLAYVGEKQPDLDKPGNGGL
jgi:hypothetical protein